MDGMVKIKCEEDGDKVAELARLHDITSVPSVMSMYAKAFASQLCKYRPDQSYETWFWCQRSSGQCRSTS